MFSPHVGRQLRFLESWYLLQGVGFKKDVDICYGDHIALIKEIVVFHYHITLFWPHLTSAPVSRVMIPIPCFPQKASLRRDVEDCYGDHNALIINLAILHL